MKVSGNLYQDNDRLFILVTSSQTLFTVPSRFSILAEDSITCTTIKSYETVYITEGHRQESLKDKEHSCQNQLKLQLKH